MTTSRIDGLVDDLVAEFETLEAIVSVLTDEQLQTPTPSEGWAVVDQLSHLAGFDEAAGLALESPAQFLAELDVMIRDGDDPIARYVAQGRAMAPSEVVAWWSEAHGDLVIAARAGDPTQRVPWFGPPMSAMSFITARLMELWAHGQDIRDALGLAPSISSRLRHVAHIGVGAMPYSFMVRELAPPEVPIDVVLRAADGEEDYRWGSGDADDRVVGDVLDFCLVVTQRRHIQDTALEIVGDAATQWMSIAQAFAGGAGAGRAPRDDRG